MSATRTASLTAVALAGLRLAAVPLGLAASDARAGETVRVITHTSEYCAELSARARTLGAAVPSSATTPGHAEARQLVIEADRLCAQGQIRPGIIRLRRAIMLLRAETQPEPGGR